MKKVHLNALDLNLLRVFDALHEERSVTRAGARLGLTQSAISHALNRLRHLFADELFIRSVDGMQPTAHAAEIGPRVRNYLSEIDSHLRDEGCRGSFLVVQSTGGLYEADQAKARTALSSPLGLA